MTLHDDRELLLQLIIKVKSYSDRNLTIKQRCDMLEILNETMMKARDNTLLQETMKAQESLSLKKEKAKA